MKIYVASSWRNTFQQAVVGALRDYGHEVYDFKGDGDGWGSSSGPGGFSWSEVDPQWQSWPDDIPRYLEGLKHPRAVEGFNRDMDALKRSDACVMVMPCGPSASMEMGWACGGKRRVVVYVPGMREPDLMVCMADLVTDKLTEVLAFLASGPSRPVEADLPLVIHKSKLCSACHCSQTLPASLQNCQCFCHPQDRMIMVAVPAPPADTSTFLVAAEKIARVAHITQLDRVNGDPYINHIERVVSMVEGEARAVAWLHDVLEDTTVTRDDLVSAGIPAHIIGAVELLTRVSPFDQHERYQEYIDILRLSGNSLALAVKIADLRDHLRPNCPDRLRARYEKAILSLGVQPASDAAPIGCVLCDLGLRSNEFGNHIVCTLLSGEQYSAIPCALVHLAQAAHGKDGKPDHIAESGKMVSSDHVRDAGEMKETKC